MYAASPIRTCGVPGKLVEIRQEGQRIVIHHEFMDVIREIHMDLKHPDNISPGEMWLSIGRFERETLVIESVGFEESVISPHAADSGMLHSENSKLVGRLMINLDNGDLELSWTAENPSYFKGQLSDKLSFIKTELEVECYNCELEPFA